MSVDVLPERPGKTNSLYSASDEDWAEAVRRAAIIRPLSEARRCSKAVVQAAARSLGLSISRTYSLVQDFRSHPLTASLLPLKRGRIKGTRRLDPKVEARIDEAVDAIWPELTNWPSGTHNATYQEHSSVVAAEIRQIRAAPSSDRAGRGCRESYDSRQCAPGG